MSDSVASTLVEKWQAGEVLDPLEREELPFAFAALILGELEHICEAMRRAAEVNNFGRG